MKRLLIRLASATLIYLMSAVSCAGTADPTQKDNGDQEGEGQEQTTEPEKKKWKIMTIGDSITANSDPGYRGFLYRNLVDGGFDVDFVGPKQTMPTEPTGVDLDPDNAGFGGYTIGPDKAVGDDWGDSMGHGCIYYHLDKGYELLTKYRTDVIVLMIGTNDFFNVKDKSYNANETGPERLDALVGKIYDILPKVKLLVSNITPVAWNADFNTPFNKKVEGIVQKYSDDGYQCYYADVRWGIKWELATDLSSDQLHPAVPGNKKIADYFYKCLSEQVLK